MQAARAHTAHARTLALAMSESNESSGIAGKSEASVGHVRERVRACVRAFILASVHAGSSDISAHKPTLLGCQP